jgi:hypothetical protein
LGGIGIGEAPRVRWPIFGFRVPDSYVIDNHMALAMLGMRAMRFAGEVVPSIHWSMWRSTKATEMGMSPRDLDAKVVGAEANIDADSITLNHFLDQLIHGAAIARFRVP